ncbi:hypothetical protein ABRY23_12230 [Melioribacteraceae bacterium 4301-Me]|uniref:hypothetical protein n=1 Tax=Pyranulibacter aquaticus TaxID=3163344 RepID=UPI003598F055
MKVEFGKPNFNIYQNREVQAKSVKKESEEKTDSFEISEKAKELNESLNSVTDDTKLNEIKNKIQQKFYDSEDVLNVVVSRILKDIK